MITYLVTILLLSLTIESGANLITESYIFEGYRNLWVSLKEKDTPFKLLFDKLAYSSSCHLCTSHQLSFFVCLVPTLPFTSSLILQVLVNALLIGRTSYLFHVVYEKFFLSQGINLNIMNTHILHDGDKEDS